jgi:purine-binding chemotaxis protein CheW
MTIELTDTPKSTYVIFALGEYQFGIDDVHAVRDIVRGLKITPVPLASKEVMGVLNLRSRIITVIDAKKILDIAGPPPDPETARHIVIERDGEAYALVVDRVSEVKTLPDETLDTLPRSIPEVWRRCSKCIHKLDGQILVILDLARLMDFLDKNTEDDL